MTNTQKTDLPLFLLGLLSIALTIWVLIAGYAVLTLVGMVVTFFIFYMEDQASKLKK